MNKSPPEAMKEVDTPEQTVLFPVMLQTGKGFYSKCS
jgi:hypothetical protein